MKKTVDEIINIPKDYYVLSEPKSRIASQIKNAMNEKNLSVRKLGEEVGFKHPQIVKVTRGDNYNINTLLRILDGLDLEIVVKKKGSY